MTPAGSATPAWTTALAFVSCSLIWGSTFLVISIGNDTMPPIWAATLRLALAAAILFAIAALTRQRLPRGAALRAAALYGLFQFGCNFPLLYWGETAVPSGLAAIIFATIPLTTAVFTRIAGLEKLAPARVVGAIVAIAGVAIIFSGELSQRVRLLPMGAILAATWVACIGTIALKKGPKQSPIGANAVGAAVGAVVCWSISLVIREPQPWPASWPAIFPILYLAIAGSVGAFVIFTWLITHWEMTRASYIAVVLPVVALTLGVLVRHERFTGTSLIGSAVVLLGVAVGLQLVPLPRVHASARSRSSH